MVLGPDHPDGAWREISSYVASIWTISIGSPSTSSSRIVSPLSTRVASKINNWGVRHRCPRVNCSLQLKHNPCSLFLCISSHESYLIGVEVGLRNSPIGVLIGWLNGVDRTAFFFLTNLSCFIRASSNARRSVRGLNMHTSVAISYLRPPKKVPMRAF